jgi:sporulation protein YlmC with PRC-barrel domain
MNQNVRLPRHHTVDTEAPFRFTEGMNVCTSNGRWGELVDVIVDPEHRTVSHLVVRPEADGESRLVPLDAVRSTTDGLELSWSDDEVRAAPSVRSTSFEHFENSRRDNEDWDIGVGEAAPWAADPLFVLTGFGLVLDAQSIPGLTFDRIPRGSAELRRSSDVVSSDDHLIGHVDGFVVDRDAGVTHLVLQRGHFWGERDVTIPVDDIADVATDRIRLRVSRDEVGRYPSTRIHRRTRRARRTAVRSGSFPCAVGRADDGGEHDA